VGFRICGAKIRKETNKEMIIQIKNEDENRNRKLKKNLN
jgi:hypothetical protein